jgi:transcriptional regulator with XRE-family HTH domain
MPTDHLRQLGRALKARRIELGLKQTELAKAAGWKQSEISKLEIGRTSAPRMDVLVRVGLVLGLSPNDLATMAGWYQAPPDRLDAPAEAWLGWPGEILGQLPRAQRLAVLQQCSHLAEPAAESRSRAAASL